MIAAGGNTCRLFIEPLVEIYTYTCGHCDIHSLTNIFVFLARTLCDMLEARFLSAKGLALRSRPPCRPRDRMWGVSDSMFNMHFIFDLS